MTTKKLQVAKVHVRTNCYLYELPVAVFIGRPSVVMVIESGLSRQPVFIVETRRGCDLVICDLS